MDSRSADISPEEIRRIILMQAKRAGVGHIGSALSIVDIIAVLYSNILRINDPNDPDRDRFILSKGHAAMAIYGVLFLKGWLTKKELNTYCADESLLGVHPEHTLRGIDFSTGSLGHGLSIGIGSALAAKKQKSSRRVFVLLSDAECNEGSIWEAIMFAAHHKISNLVAIIDLNGQQAFGYTKNVLNISPMAERWRVFGWDAHEVDGHNPHEITKTINGLDTDSYSFPHVIIAHTTFGKGVSYMENKIKWHYSSMSEEEYQLALKENEGLL
ncbi:MAG: transketolase [Candidatus Omnitrophota bacterium]